MDSFYPLGTQENGFSASDNFDETSSAAYHREPAFNYAYHSTLEIPPSYGSASWMQLDSALPAPSHSSSLYKPFSSHMDTYTPSSIAPSSSTMMQSPPKNTAMDDLPPRNREAKRNRTAQTEPAWEAEKEAVSKDLKKIRLPATELLLIHVKTLSGQKLCIECDPASLVLQMKHHIEALNGVPAHEQRLLFGGIALNDYRPISEYQIQDRSTIYMVVSLRGG